MNVPQQCPMNPTSEMRRSFDRRTALTKLWAGLLSAAAVARSAWAQKKLALGLDKADKLKTVGGSAILKVQGRDLLFIRASEESVRVLDPTCTHKKCTVEYNAQKQKIICPCHGSNFSIDGSVLNGPADKPLQTFEASLDSQNNRVIFSVE
jgi:cytochrome b6-f complex iron-sulfur subunit